MKNFIQKNWWKILLVIWLFYAVAKLNGFYFHGSLLEIIFISLVVFAAGYDLGKNSK